MANSVKLLDTVAVLVDLPSLVLSAGEVGAAVEELGGGAFEVEFCDASGATYGLHALRADQIVVLHTRGEALEFQAAV